GANLGQEGKKISKWAAEPIDRPGHDDIDFPARSGLMQRVESGPLIPPFATADPVILINLADLPAGTLGDLPQLALLIGRGLVDCGYPEVESGAFPLFQMMGVFAEFERSMIQERVRAGLRRAKDDGRKLGRPRIARQLEERIVAALKAGETIRGVANKFDVNPSTVQRIKHPFVVAA